MSLIIILGVALRYVLKYAVTKTLLVLGLGFVTYTGVGSLVDQLETALMNQYGQLTSDLWNVMSLCGIDVVITILISTLTLSMTIKGMVAGAKILTNLGR